MNVVSTVVTPILLTFDKAMLFLAKYWPVFNLLYDLLENQGASQDDVVAALRDLQLQGSDQAMREELKPPR